MPKKDQDPPADEPMDLPLGEGDGDGDGNGEDAEGGGKKAEFTLVPADDSLANIGRIVPRPIVTEMEESYLNYAMSVIVSRALPDARDGLKPVQRRILYVMHELGLRSAARFRKSAAVVGDVMGKYHPHGDSSIYEALARMAQDFSMRHPLVHGQGNFGSIDGDNPAAMRYTEAKMAKIVEEMLSDIESDTVDFAPNYDGSRKEPIVLPAKIPNLLLNGTVGIAVGMATNIPPHNLGELADAVIHLIDNPGAGVEELLQFIQGPDFPTGGIVYDIDAIRQAYLTGRGSVVVRGKAEIEDAKGGRYCIRISEIPFQVNKSTMIEKMAQLVQDKVISGISDIRDESDREGIRVIVELKKDSYPQKVLNQLFKHTDLQSSFGYNCIALADGIQPRLMNLQELLGLFVGHRRTVTRRRITFERDRAKERAHILEGLKKALDHIDAVVQTIKKSKDKEVAKINLIKNFKLTSVQADAILQMRLQTLSGLEQQKIDEELVEKRKFIAACEELLKSQQKMDDVIKKEVTDLKEKYADARRTTVVKHAVGQFSAKDTIPNAPMIVALTAAGYVKRLSPMQFRAQHRGGKGVKGMTTKDDDEILSLLHVMNHDDLLFFTNTGRVFRLPAYEIPQGSRVAKGQAIVNLLQLQPDELIAAILKADLEDKTHLFMVTEQGTVKRTEINQFENIRRSGLIAQKMNAGDHLRWVIATNGRNEILILSKKGKAIRFKEVDVRSMGRAAAGVRGIRLLTGDKVVEADAIDNAKTGKLLVVMENGLGKMTPVEEYRFQGRGGSGVKAAQLTAKTGEIIGGCILEQGEDGDLFCISKQGQAIRMKLSDIPSRGRATQGVIVMRLRARDKVATMSIVMEDPEAEEAVQEAAEDLREEEVLVIKKEERRVKRAATIGKKGGAVATVSAVAVMGESQKVRRTPERKSLTVVTKHPKLLKQPKKLKTSKPPKRPKALKKPKAPKKPAKKFVGRGIRKLQKSQRRVGKAVKKAEKGKKLVAKRKPASKNLHKKKRK